MKPITYSEYIELACSKACRDVAQVLIDSRENGTPVQTAKIVSVALERLLSYRVQGDDWGLCLEYLTQKAQDDNWKRLTNQPNT